jgi:hypothetical protein
MSVVIAVCAIVGALAGIAGSAAAPSKSTQAQKAKAKAKALKKQAKAQFRTGRRAPGGPGFFFGGHGGPGGGPVHSETVVPNADGTGFDTITEDAGKLTSVDANTLNITEGTDKAKYKDVSVDVGSSPTVIRNGATATLGDLKPDDQVRVIRGTPKGTFVIAEDAAFLAQEQKDHEGFGERHGAPPLGAPGSPGDNQNGSDSSGSSSSGASS